MLLRFKLARIHPSLEFAVVVLWTAASVSASFVLRKTMYEEFVFQPMRTYTLSTGRTALQVETNTHRGLMR